MAMKFFRFPFAVSGDKTTVPDATQGDGSVSYEQGYPLDYSRNPATDPAAKRVERFKMNQILNDVTTYLRSLSLLGTPDFVTAAENGGVALSYAIGAQVMFDPGTGTKLRYESIVAGNTTDPSNTSNWRQVTTYVGKLINVRVLSTPGTTTYTPTVGTKAVVVEVVGGGGGGGGAGGTTATTTAVGGGGASGAYAKSYLTSGFAGVSVTVGAGGTAGPIGVAGGSGGSSSFGALITASGGGGGRGQVTATTPPNLTVGGDPLSASGGTVINSMGQFGGNGQSATISNAASGYGAPSMLAAGALPRGAAGGSGNGNNATGFGGGGGGALALINNGTGQTGGVGAPGAVIIWEYA